VGMKMPYNITVNFITKESDPNKVHENLQHTLNAAEAIHTSALNHQRLNIENEIQQHSTLLNHPSTSDNKKKVIRQKIESLQARSSTSNKQTFHKLRAVPPQLHAIVSTLHPSTLGQWQLNGLIDFSKDIICERHGFDIHIDVEEEQEII